MPAASLSTIRTNVEISVDVRGAQWGDVTFDAAGLCRTAARVALSSAQAINGPVEISVVLANDDFVQELNRTWRGVDAATNVLAFPCSDDDGAPDAERLLGDVIVAFETSQREAADLRLPLEHHFAHLIVHGVLHLLGYDHIDDAEADIMEKMEVQALALLGIGNPYEDDAGNG